MTRLFIRFYVGVLVVLFLAWFIHGRVSENRSDADMARVVTIAHTGGARLVADELNATSTPEQRDHVLDQLQNQFDYDLTIDPIESLSASARQRLQEEGNVIYVDKTIVTRLKDGKNIVRLGEFPDFRREEIEAALAGWMRMSRDRLDAVRPYEREATISELQREFSIPVELIAFNELPGKTQDKIAAGQDKVSFYRVDGGPWFSAIQLADQQAAIRFGPFVSFENIDQKAATTTLALVLLPAALAIALLLRPVAWQLRQLENAAETMATGDLSVRVEQNRMNSAKPLAQAFNHMASRTESLVRTQRELLQAVSHELRTPLARMRFAIDLIENAKTDEERKKRLRTLDASTEELNGLVGELLSYVRMETAELQVEPELISVLEMLDILIPKFVGLHPGISFSSSLNDAAQLNPTVFADRIGFQRAIGNLISNAGKHARKNVVVHITIEGDSTVIDVDDDGNGIPQTDRERVFEPFVRLQTIGETKGVGLGLALVQRIVLRNGGKVEVQTSDLAGCRIRSTWPRQSSQTGSP